MVKTPQWAKDYPHRANWEPGDVIEWLTNLLVKHGYKLTIKNSANKLAIEDPPIATN